jgi:hypothetical protein
MTRRRDEQPQPDSEAAPFIARLVAHYTPTPLTPTRRVALDEALWARLQRPRKTKLVPALAAVAVGIVVAWLTFPGLFTPMPRGGEPRVSVVETPGSIQWAYELIYPRELTGATERDDSHILPDDYRVIAQVFMDEE